MSRHENGQGLKEAAGGRSAGDVPAFCEPWEAQAFALVVALQDKGVFTTAEWATALGVEVHGDHAADDGHDYYEHWLAALEKLMVAKGLVSTAAIDDATAAWERAAHATPHGKPILLENDPRRSR